MIRGNQTKERKEREREREDRFEWAQKKLGSF